MNKSTRAINKHLFEKLCNKAKQTYYQSILKDRQNDEMHMAYNERNHRKMQS